MKITRSMIAGAALGLTAALAVPAPAQAASTYCPHYWPSNSSKSITGAIIHGVSEGELTNTSITLQPGAGTKTAGVYFRFCETGSPYGMKVWQPAGTRLKTYRWVGVFVRNHNYHCQDRGRDVWVTKGWVDLGGSMRVKILPCR